MQSRFISCPLGNAAYVADKCFTGHKEMSRRNNRIPDDVSILAFLSREAETIPRMHPRIEFPARLKSTVQLTASVQPTRELAGSGLASMANFILSGPMIDPIVDARRYEPCYANRRYLLINPRSLRFPPFRRLFLFSRTNPCSSEPRRRIFTSKATKL